MGTSKREQIFNNNIGLVHRVINSNYSWTKVSQYKDDVFNEGCIALLHSIDNFDNSKGIQFSTYAYKNIYFFIQMYINKVVQQKRKYNRRVEDENGKLIKYTADYMSADICSYNVIVSDGSDEVGELLNSTPLMKDEEGYQDIDDNLFIEYCLNFLMKLQNTGQTKYKDIYIITKYKMQNLTNEKIGQLIGKSRTYVNNKFNFAVEIIKKNIA